MTLREYPMCRQQVTVYRKTESGIFRQVLSGCYLEEKETRNAEKRYSSRYKPQTFAGILADMTRCNGFSDTNTRFISNEAEKILVRSGVPTSAAGFFLPLDPEYRSINATNAPLSEFIAAFNRCGTFPFDISPAGAFGSSQVDGDEGCDGGSRVC